MSTQTKYEFSVFVNSETLTCGQCGLPFAVPEPWVTQKRRDHSTFYCPNGHARHFPGETAEQKRIRQLEQDASWYANRLKSETQQKESAKRSLAATRGVLTRTKKLIAAGECPCCRKEYKRLAAHMAQEHPGYVESTAEELRTP